MACLRAIHGSPPDSPPIDPLGVYETCGGHANPKIDLGTWVSDPALALDKSRKTSSFMCLRWLVRTLGPPAFWIRLAAYQLGRSLGILLGWN